MNKTDGGPAFPLAVPSGHNTICDGMTLRQLYAGMAMQGCINTAEADGFATDADRSFWIRECAKVAKEAADALIAELEADHAE